MDSGGGGGTESAFDRDDNDRMPSLESSSTGRHRHHLEKDINMSSNDHHDHFRISSKSFVRMTILVVAVAVACFVLYNSDYHNRDFSITWYNPLSSLSKGISFTKTNQSSFPFGPGDFSNSPGEFKQGNGSETNNNISSSSPTNTAQENLSSVVHQGNEERKLEKVLKEAAMENKIVIITNLNAAWIAPNSIFDLFLESFRIGNGTQRLLSHVVVIALDEKAYSRCMELHPHCYALRTEGVDFSGAANFMTPDYLKIVWRKIELLQTVLQMGYSFIFTDVDILWFRDPFPHFYGGADIQMACDRYRHNSSDSKNIANTGFHYVISNDQTIQFYQFWHRSQDKFPATHDQNVFNMIKGDPFVHKIGIKIKFLDTAFFGGFCEPSKDLNVVCTMHANCCVGLGKKIHDLRMSIDDWKKYMALSSKERKMKQQTWTVPRICGRRKIKRGK